MDLLGLLGRGDLAGAAVKSQWLVFYTLQLRRRETLHGPDWLVGDNHVGPVVDLVGNGLQLAGDNVRGGASLTLLQLLANTGNHADASLQGVRSLLADKLLQISQQIFH